MYRCDQCGSPHVQAMAWANINTGAFVEWDEGNNRYWCEDCESAGRDQESIRVTCAAWGMAEDDVYAHIEDD